MGKLTGLKPETVFKYFEEICAIPHGSGDMEKIADYCVSFAMENNLKYVRDEANNVIIYKDGTKGMESCEPVILQGHIDMVCQKTADCQIDFEKDGLDIYADGDFVKANGTTLGADNGIAVSMIMAILASNEIAHPPIEAVLTTDEEIGMIGAGKLDVSVLKGKRMINIDSEEEAYLTVSCAGGSDFKANLPLERKKSAGKSVKIEISGLMGGHSGVEIDKGRVNANILAGRLLNAISDKSVFDIVSINGGTKGNAIPYCCEIELVARDSDAFLVAFDEYAELLKKELKDREKGLEITCTVSDEGKYEVFDEDSKEKILYFLLNTPNGIIDMSMEISGLVETSLNLGILNTTENEVYMQYALRSNKATALDFMELKMKKFAKAMGFVTSESGRYEPWEYNRNSRLQELYKEVYLEKTGKEPIVTAIHAGLECAVFSASIPELDCISIGPDMYDVHTTKEKLSITSTGKIYGILCEMLGKM